MRKVTDIIPKNMNIKWKLTLWAAGFMLLLFFSYTIVQYFVLQSWATDEEKQIIQKKMSEVTAYLEGMPPDEPVSESAHFLNVLNEDDQMIRIVDETSSPIVTISDDDADEWITPRHVTEEELVRFKQEEDDDPLLIYRMPIETHGNFKGTVEISRDMEHHESLFEQMMMLVLITGIIAVILSFIGGRFISSLLLKPIKSMIGTMKKVKENGLRERVPIDRKQDEMTELGLMFNELMDSLEKSFHQQQQFVEDASHELKTPLTVIHGHLSLINRWGKDNPEVLERSVQLSINETERIIHLVTELLTLSKDHESRKIAEQAESNKLKQMLATLIENYQLVHSDFEIAANLQVDPELRLRMSQNHFDQMMIILLDNAINYSTDKKTINLDVRKTADGITIEVTDFGIGIDQDEIPFVFDRFYRVDKSRSRKNGGNGLGLSIAKRIVEMYGGTIEIKSKHGEWTKVIIMLPGAMD